MNTASISTGVRSHGRLFGLIFSVIVVGLATGCADLQDQPADEEDADDDMPVIQIDNTDSVVECIESCPDDDSIATDLIVEADLGPLDDFVVDDDENDGSGDDGTDDGSGDDGTDDGSGDDGSSDDGSGDDGSGDDGTDDGSGDDGSSDDGSGDDGSGDDGSGDDGDGTDDDIGYCDLDGDIDECPDPLGYWKNSDSDEWPVSVAGDCDGNPDQTGCICDGMSWEDVLDMSPAGDLWTILAKQRIVAALNAANGACDAESEEYLMQSAPLVADCEINADNEELAEELAGRLKLFNQGALSPECLN